MKNSHPRSSHRLWKLIIVSAVLCSAALTAGVAASAAAQSHSHHAVPRALAIAAGRSRHDDRILVADAKTLKRCRAAHGSGRNVCVRASRHVQRAGSTLRSAERALARIARGTAQTASSGPVRGNPALAAPKIVVSGQTLTWALVDGLKNYVFVRKVPGQTAQYSMVSGSSTTPPPVPGMTVKYSVRTSVNGSAWATEQSITYPHAVETKKPVETKPVETKKTEAPKETVDTQAAPVIHVSGNTLSWSAVGNVSAYVLASKAPGKAEQFTAVSGTSVTPAVVPGVTVHYSVRTAVDGSAWSPEVAISYPAAVVTPTEPPAETTPPAEIHSGAFEMGEVAGSDLTYEMPFIQQVGAHTARLQVPIGTPASQITGTVEAYAKAGIKPLLLAVFSGRLPSSAEAQNLASWAAAFGPAGTVGKKLPAGTAVTDIEFGNETSYTYQYSDNSQAGYATRAQTYAIRVEEAVTAIRAVSTGVGVVAQGDSGGNGPEWAKQMFKAVPNLGQYVSGWSIHPYGPEWQSRIDTMISTTQADGAPSSIPVFVTEWGLDTDNGRCLEYNFGWNKCMTYSEAASTLATTVAQMKARYGGRLAAFYLYQAHDQKPTGTATSLESYFGAVQSNGAAKGSYTTEVESLLAANA